MNFYKMNKYVSFEKEENYYVICSFPDPPQSNCVSVRDSFLFLLDDILYLSKLVPPPPAHLPCIFLYNEDIKFGGMWPNNFIIRDHPVFLCLEKNGIWHFHVYESLVSFESTPPPHPFTHIPRISYVNFVHNALNVWLS